MRVYLDQIGCRLNYSEMETLARRLVAAGHRTVETPDEAQVVVFNSCAVTMDASKASRQRIRQLHRAQPKALIALTGCWATLEPETAAALPGVTLVADNGRKELLHLLLEPWSAELDDPAELAAMQPEGNAFEATLVTDQARIARTRGFVKVQDGCNNRCTFCVVTLARGDSRSRSVAEVVTEVQGLAQMGVQEAVLTGVHLGSYGRDLEGSAAGDLKELAAAILADTEIARLRLSSLEPWELAEGFFELWQRWPSRLCPHLHLPLQAGTDKQLRRMARRCTTASYRRLVNEARAAIPGLVVTTDLIAGFPGESDADFATGLAFVEEMRFAHAHIFPFSARPGTAAAQYGEQVPAPLKKARVRRLAEVVEDTGRAERRRFVGSVRPVLWENTRHELTGTSECLWTGYTDNYLKVTTVAPAQVDLCNRLTAVRLEALEGDTLHGTIIG
jgi:threonylcarbamoyladenosine tRNA methylthiotransferase MtaB